MPCSPEVSSLDSWKDESRSVEERPSTKFHWVPLEYYALLRLGIDIHSRLLPHQTNLLNATFSHRRVRTSHLGVNNRQLCGPRIEKGSNGHSRVTVKLDVRSGEGTVPGIVATIRIKDYLLAKHRVILRCDHTPLVIIPSSGERFALQCLEAILMADSWSTDYSNEEIHVPFVKLHALAQMPKYSSPGAAGADLHSVETVIVPAHGKALISTGIAVQLPANHYGRIAPRSGLSVKFSLHTGAGVVDGDYRGEVKVLLFNMSKVDYKIESGDRIAQFIMERCSRANFIPAVDLSSSIRGANGFGSTGNQ